MLQKMPDMHVDERTGTVRFDARDTTLAKNAAKLIDSSGSCAIKYT